MAKTTMYLRGIRQDLVREVKAQAAREGITLAAFVERALDRATHQAPPGSPRLSEIAREIDWYEANKRGLLERYEGEFLAIVDNEVVDHDADSAALAARVAQRYGGRSVYMPKCQRSREVINVRSPRKVL